MELQEKLMEISQYVNICEHKSYYNEHLKAKGKFSATNCNKDVKNVRKLRRVHLGHLKKTKTSNLKWTHVKLISKMSKTIKSTVKNS